MSGAPAAAQEGWVGVGVGTLQARFEGPATVEFEARRGWSLGVFADLASPLRPVDVRVEGRWVRRGGDEVRGGGGAESDLLALPLAAGPRLRFGAASLFPFAGFEIAYPLGSRRSADLEVGFGDASSVEFGGFVGASLDVHLPRELKVVVELRTLRGLSGSFRGPAGQLDPRATEFTLRLARPLG
jgi:hypothetical protein